MINKKKPKNETTLIGGRLKNGSLTLKSEFMAFQNVKSDTSNRTRNNLEFISFLLFL